MGGQWLQIVSDFQPLFPGGHGMDEENGVAGETEAVPCEGVCRDLTKQPHTLQLGFAASRRRKGWREIPRAVAGVGALLIHRRSRNSGFSRLRKVGVVESGASHLPTCFLLMVGCLSEVQRWLGSAEAAL